MKFQTFSTIVHLSVDPGFNVIDYVTDIIIDVCLSVQRRAPYIRAAERRSPDVYWDSSELQKRGNKKFMLSIKSRY